MLFYPVGRWFAPTSYLPEGLPLNTQEEARHALQSLRSIANDEDATRWLVRAEQALDRRDYESARSFLTNGFRGKSGACLLSHLTSGSEICGLPASFVSSKQQLEKVLGLLADLDEAQKAIDASSAVSAE